MGVILGIIAAAHFGGRPPMPLDVLAFGDEEGSRFPSTLSSSSAVVGAFDPATLGVADRKGVSFADALEAYGKDPAHIPSAAYAKGEALGYIEAHIEQGPLLEAAREPLGVVTGIVGQSRLGVTVTGEAGHAGTVPMGLRRDALAGAAAMVSLIEEVARARKDMVATVGRLEVKPGATNVIPASVTFTIDIRSMSDAERAEAIATIRQKSRAIAETRHLSVVFEPQHEEAAVACDDTLQALVADAIGGLGHRPMRLPSGAGHDAQMMARLCPAAMLFVRCRGGISHNPAEFCSPADMGLAAAALIRFIEAFAAARS
jgi:allantoate deiminase